MNKIKTLKNILDVKIIDEAIRRLAIPMNFRVIIHTGRGFSLPSTLKILAHYLLFLYKDRQPNIRYCCAFFSGKYLFVDKLFENTNAAEEFKEANAAVFERYEKNHQSTIELRAIVNDALDLFRIICILIKYIGCENNRGFDFLKFKKYYEDANVFNISDENILNHSENEDPLLVEFNSLVKECISQTYQDWIGHIKIILSNLRDIYLEYRKFKISYKGRENIYGVENPLIKMFYDLRRDLNIELAVNKINKFNVPMWENMGYYYKEDFIVASSLSRNNVSLIPADIKPIFYFCNMGVENKSPVELMVRAATPVELKLLDSGLNELIKDTRQIVISNSKKNTRYYTRGELSEITDFIVKLTHLIPEEEEGKKGLFRKALQILYKIRGAIPADKVNSMIFTLLKTLPFFEKRKDQNFIVPIQKLALTEALKRLSDQSNIEVPAFFEDYPLLKGIKRKTLGKIKIPINKLNYTEEQVKCENLLSVLFGEGVISDYAFLYMESYRKYEYEQAKKAQENCMNFAESHIKFWVLNSFLEKLKILKKALDNDRSGGLSVIKKVASGLNLNILPLDGKLIKAVNSIKNMNGPDSNPQKHAHQSFHAEFLRIWFIFFQAGDLSYSPGFAKEMHRLADWGYAPACYVIFKLSYDINALVVAAEQGYALAWHDIGLLFLFNFITKSKRKWISLEFSEEKINKLIPDLLNQLKLDMGLNASLDETYIYYGCQYLAASAQQGYAPAAYHLSIFLWEISKNEKGLCYTAFEHYLKYAACRNYEPALLLRTAFHFFKANEYIVFDIVKKFMDQNFEEEKSYFLEFKDLKMRKYWFKTMINLLQWEIKRDLDVNNKLDSGEARL